MSTTCVLCGTAAKQGACHDHLGFCQSCAMTLPSFEALLESLDSPAALLSRDLVILSENRRLRGITHYGGSTAVGAKIGLALGCVHAARTEECGRTDACAECWLRRSVDLARISGARIPGVPWDLLPHTGPRRPYAISAVKTREAVVVTLRPPAA